MIKAIITIGLYGLLLSLQPSFAQAAHTYQELEHSKLYQGRGMKGHKLTEAKGDGGFVGTGLLLLHTTLPSRLEFFQGMACQADAVILGNVVAQTSLLTPDETFIFTDSKISTAEVIKDNLNSHLSPNEVVTITRPGGTVQESGRKLTVKLTEFRDFSVGDQYLFFLKFLPATQDYEAFGDKTFDLRNGLVFNLTRESFWDEHQPLGHDAAATLADARNAVTAPCN